MSLVLNRIAKFFDNARLMYRLAVASSVLVLVGAFHQGGGAFVAWHVFSWFPLLGFAGVCATLLCAATRHDEPYLGRITLAALGLALFAPDPLRFPGLQLSWLWLAVAVAAGLYFIHVALVEPSEYYTFYMNTGAMFSYAIRFGAVVLTIALPAIYHTWTMVENVVIIDAVLATCFVGLSPYRVPRYRGTLVRA